MRVIAGSAKGHRLISLKGTHTRPTLDRVKESLFSVIAGYLPEARVLDLFSGSGSLAIEALSRGAGSALCVERSRQAVRVIHKNLELTRPGKQGRSLAHRRPQCAAPFGRIGAPL